MLRHRDSPEIDTGWVSGRNETSLPVHSPTHEGHGAEVEDVAVGGGCHRRRLRGRRDNVVGRPRLDVDVQESVAR